LIPFAIRMSRTHGLDLFWRAADLITTIDSFCPML
jgi:hypothetical protein